MGPVAAVSSRVVELRESVARHERQVASWQPVLDMYECQVQGAEHAQQACKKGLIKAALWVGGGVAGMAVGMMVPGAQLAALVGFGCFFKGWKDSFGNLMGMRAYNREKAVWQGQLDKSRAGLAEVQGLLDKARSALLAGEAEQEVRLLNEGMKRTSAILETKVDVHVGGVRLKKR